MYISNMTHFLDEKGNIPTEIPSQANEIYWYCPDCENEGVISHWKGSRWDNNISIIT
jgi:uncharacterized protein with PIN domain